MRKQSAKRGFLRKQTAMLVVASLAMPAFMGCGGSKNDANNIPAPVDDTQRGAQSSTMNPNPAPHTGMSGKEKVAIVAGAALLYYLYKHHQKQNGQEVQYYKSKNGRVYYRDPQTHQVHWVSPVTVPAAEAADYSGYKGYNNSTGGQDYGNADASPAQ